MRCPHRSSATEAEPADGKQYSALLFLGADTVEEAELPNCTLAFLPPAEQRFAPPGQLVDGSGRVRRAA